MVVLSGTIPLKNEDPSTRRATASNTTVQIVGTTSILTAMLGLCGVFYFCSSNVAVYLDVATGTSLPKLFVEFTGVMCLFLCL